ncbi:11031_t:CDS:2 [Diversispora eburnea]|uniref:11031_t:CDS:1 n=1 Tax=Diversispora eburnea TaxID=1213867 RepID=A0A9N8UV81_9GLOM|nr:11031_t:CDS:2 [Diversispora eburnea]
MDLSSMCSLPPLDGSRKGFSSSVRSLPSPPNSPRLIYNESNKPQEPSLLTQPIVKGQNLNSFASSQHSQLQASQSTSSSCSSSIWSRPTNSPAMRFVNATTNFSTPTPPDYSQFGNINSNSFSTNEQAMAKLLKVIDHCNQISQFSTQYRDSRMNNQSSWTPVSESHITNMINRTYDILNILIGLKGELNSRTAAENAPVDVGEIVLARKPRSTNGISQQRTKYRKRSKRAAPPGRCHSCNISETPEWRRGPDGARTLCNACGLHFAKITRKRALSAMQHQFQQAAPHSASTNITNYNNTTINTIHTRLVTTIPPSTTATTNQDPSK